MRKEIIKLVLLFVIANEYVSKIIPSKVQLAINCGGEKIKAKSGVTYIGDKYYNGGEISAFAKGQDIKYTSDQEIYQTERWSKDNFSYKIPIEGEGSFVLILQFSEVYFTSKNEKVFDVELNGNKVIKDLDIFEKVGKNAAFDEFIKLEVKNGELKVKDEKIRFDGQNLEIKLVKKEKDNPKINGIMLVKGTLDDTHYSEYHDAVEGEEKIRGEKEKQHRDFQRMSKSIDYEDFENDFIDDGRFNVGGNGFFSVKGVVFGIVIFVLGYFLFVK